MAKRKKAPKRRRSRRRRPSSALGSPPEEHLDSALKGYERAARFAPQVSERALEGQCDSAFEDYGELASVYSAARTNDYAARAEDMTKAARDKAWRGLKYAERDILYACIRTDKDKR